MRACVSSVDPDERELVDREGPENAPEMLGRTWVDGDSDVRRPIRNGRRSGKRGRRSDSSGRRGSAATSQSLLPPGVEEPFRRGGLRFGVKYYILRYLAAVGCEVTVVPAPHAG